MNSLTDTATQVAHHLQSRPLSPPSIVTAAALADTVIMALCVWFAAYLSLPPDLFEPGQTAFVGGVVAALTAGMLIFGEAYRPHSLIALERTTATALAAIALTSILAKPYVSPDQGLIEWMLAVAATAALPLFGLRLAARSFVRWAMAFGALERRAIVAGGGVMAEQVILGLAEQPDNDIRVVAIFDDRDDDRSPAQVLGVPRVGNFWELIGFVAEAEVDMVIIALPLEAEDRIRWLLSTFIALPHQIHLANFAKGYGFRDRASQGLILARQETYGISRRWRKRALDLGLGSLALLLLSPVMLAAALAIRIDSPGPVLFTQRRHGFANRDIPVLKFRSMYHDRADQKGIDVVRRGGDPRVTRVGAFLRKTSIDELPQLFNVLRGDLSLVGPRPHALDARSSGQDPFADLVEDYAARHRLPPGITGWAQINGLRGGIDEPEQLRQRVAHDLYYIENWSLLFDLRILLKTPFSLLDTKNAY